jgi:hypothetical protein
MCNQPKPLMQAIDKGMENAALSMDMRELCEFERRLNAEIRMLCRRKFGSYLDREERRILRLLALDEVIDERQAANNRQDSENAVALNRFIADGLITTSEYRHIRGHLALGNRLADDLCSILGWTHRSVTRVNRLIAGYRLKLEQGKRAAVEGGPTKRIATS